MSVATNELLSRVGGAFEAGRTHVTLRYESDSDYLPALNALNVDGWHCDRTRIDAYPGGMLTVMRPKPQRMDDVNAAVMNMRDRR